MANRKQTTRKKNDLQTNIQTTKDWATRTRLKTGGELGFSGSVSSSYSTCGTFLVIFLQIQWSVLLWFTDCAYPFGIFKLFWTSIKQTKKILYIFKILTTAGIQLSQNHTVNVTLHVVKYEPIAGIQMNQCYFTCCKI
jgi:hypothetical protein